VPPELERIINKALEKDRDLRYQGATEILANLKRLKRELDSEHSAALRASETVAVISAAQGAAGSSGSVKVQSGLAAVVSGTAPIRAQAAARSGRSRPCRAERLLINVPKTHIEET
jgi:hypothetical protein